MRRPEDWAAEIGELLGAPVVLESFGPRSSDKRFAGALTASGSPESFGPRVSDRQIFCVLQ
jgi:hypothetical protein